MRETLDGLIRLATVEILNILPSVSLTTIFSIFPEHLGAVSRNYRSFCLCLISPSPWNSKDYGSPNRPKEPLCTFPWR